MAKISWRGGALLAPVPPALVTVGDMEHANIITVAWTGIVNTVPPKTYISVRPRRYSYGILKEHGEFIINLTPASLVHAADFCGMYTGAKVDKFARLGLTKEAIEGFSAPAIAECPLSLCCRVTEVIPMGSHDMFLADIVSVQINETLLDENGRLCIARADLAAFAHGEYFALGETLGNFGFSAVKKKKNPIRAQNESKESNNATPSAKAEQKHTHQKKYNSRNGAPSTHKYASPYSKTTKHNPKKTVKKKK